MQVLTTFSYPSLVRTDLGVSVVLFVDRNRRTQRKLGGHKPSDLPMLRIEPRYWWETSQVAYFHYILSYGASSSYYRLRKRHNITCVPSQPTVQVHSRDSPVKASWKESGYLTDNSFQCSPVTSSHLLLVGWLIFTVTNVCTSHFWAVVIVSFKGANMGQYSV